MSSQTNCAHFLYASNNSQFNLPHPHSFSLRVSAVALVITPKREKNCNFCMVMPLKQFARMIMPHQIIHTFYMLHTFCK